MDIERKEEQKFSFVAKMPVGKPGRDVEKKTGDLSQKITFNLELAKGIG